MCEYGRWWRKLNDWTTVLCQIFEEHNFRGFCGCFLNAKIALCKTWLDRLSPLEQSYDFVCNRAFRSCLSSAILAQSEQTRSCQTPKERSPEMFCLPWSLPQTCEGEVHAERTAKYLEVEEGIVRKVHGCTKAEVAKRAAEHRITSTICYLQRRKAAFAHPCRHDSRTPSIPPETARLSSPQVLSTICPCVCSLRRWDGT